MFTLFDFHPYYKKRGKETLQIKIVWGRWVLQLIAMDTNAVKGCLYQDLA